MPANDLESSVASHAIEERESQCTAWLIRLFIVANVVVFVVSMYINNCPKHNSGSQDKCVVGFLGRFSFQPWTDNPLLGPSSSTLEKLGALERTKVVHKHQGWRLITFRIGTIYLLSGFGGSLLSSLFIRHNVSVGAFGVFLGLLGAMLSELITNWTIHTNKAGPLIVIVYMNIAVGTFPHNDNFAHIGGFLTGFLLGFVLLPHHQSGWIERHNLPTDVIVKSKYKNYQNVLGLVSLILLITGLTVGLVMLFRGVDANDHCHWCHYLNCVSNPVSSKWKCDGSSLS